MDGCIADVFIGIDFVGVAIHTLANLQKISEKTLLDYTPEHNVSQ